MVVEAMAGGVARKLVGTDRGVLYVFGVFLGEVEVEVEVVIIIHSGSDRVLIIIMVGEKRSCAPEIRIVTHVPPLTHPRCTHSQTVCALGTGECSAYSASLPTVPECLPTLYLLSLATVPSTAPIGCGGTQPTKPTPKQYPGFITTYY